MTFPAIFMQDVRTGGEMNPSGRNGDEIRAHFQTLPNMEKVPIWMVWPGSIYGFSCKIVGRKESRMFTLHQVSMSLHWSPFKCTAKAPLIIKDWFKRPFYNLNKHWACLMLHIISSCHLWLLCVFTVSFTPPQYQPQFTAQQLVPWGWVYNCNPEPSNSSVLIMKEQHWSHLGSEPKRPPPKILSQVFADFLNDRHLYVTTSWTCPPVRSKM